MHKCCLKTKLSNMDSINNNQFEVKPINSKRKITAPCPNVYLNPALDLLANEDPMCNTAMEIVPNKKRKRTKSCDITAFENTALDLGISKAAVNEFLVRELENVRRNVKYGVEASNCPKNVFAGTSENDANDTFYIEGLTNTGLKEANEKVLPNTTFDIVNIQDDALEIGPEPNATAEHSVNASAKSADTNNREPIYSNVCVTQNYSDPENCTETIDTLHSTDISRIPHEDFDTDSGISVLEQKSLNPTDNVANVTNIATNVTNQVVINNMSNISLSFIDRLALDSPNVSDRSLYLDDDLNESNIMEIKTITIITKKKKIVEKKNTNPFLDPNLKTNEVMSTSNPFIVMKPETEYQEEALSRPAEIQVPNALMPRRLFSGDTNSTISTMNESSIESQHEYENIDNFRPESPIYENIEESYNKQSKLLGYDVSKFSAVDIMNLNKISKANSSYESNDSKKEKHSFFKAGKLSKKVFKTLKKTFKPEKVDTNITSNPYEVPRKLPKEKAAIKESGIENPALNLDISDDLEIEELSDEEHKYETIKTKRNTQLNMNVTPLRVKDNDIDFQLNRTNTPGKKVRFDSTLNQEKVITGNSFDYGIQSPGFDAKIEKYHDELENCINERKFLQQNM